MLEFTLEGTNVLMAGCTVPDSWPIIPSSGANLYTAAAGSNAINSPDPTIDIAADVIAAADTAGAGNPLNTKLIDLQNYMKLTRGFTIGDTGAGQIGNCSI